LSRKYLRGKKNPIYNDNKNKKFSVDGTKSCSIYSREKDEKKKV
jgi:hypothetical protein